MQGMNSDGFAKGISAITAQLLEGTQEDTSDVEHDLDDVD